MDYKQLLLKIMIVVLIISSLLGCFWAGSETERQVSKREKSEFEIARSIAVVNLDEGVQLEDGLINFSESIVKFPNKNFETVSLEIAKNGLEQGRYAAYIVIPSDFSMMMDSINGQLHKNQLVFCMNSRLTDETRDLVNQDITAFKELLNFNASYVYVSAILEEFHDVQDDSKVVLSNDVKDYNKIQSIIAEDLLYEPEYPEYEAVENKIEPIFLEDIFESNENAKKEIVKSVELDLDKGKKDFEKVKKNERVVASVVDKTMKSMDDYNPIYTVSDNLVCQEGVNHLYQEIDGFNFKVDEKKKALFDALDFEIRAASLGYTQSEVWRLESIIEVSANDAISNFIDTEQPKLNLKCDEFRYYVRKSANDSANIQLQDILIKVQEHYQSKLDELSANDILGNKIILSKPPAYTIDLIGSGIELYDEKFTVKLEIPKMEVPHAILQPQALDNYLINRRAENIFEDKVDEIASISKNSVDRILVTEIYGVIEENGNYQQGIYENNSKEMKNELNAYLDTVYQYDPYKHVTEETISPGMQKINKNILLTEKRQYEKNLEYLDLVDNVYLSSSDFTEETLKTIEEQSDGTVANIVKIVSELKTSKKKIHKENSALLYEFSKKLPYTRLGSLENTETYAFLVEPIQFTDVSPSNSGISANVEYEVYITALLLVLIAIMIFAGGAYIGIKLYTKQKNKSQIQI